jgi:cysteine synthase
MRNPCGSVKDRLGAVLIEDGERRGLPIAVTDAEAFECARRLARSEGMVAGISSGAPLRAALLVAARGESSDKTIVVLLADTGERYILANRFA